MKNNIENDFEIRKRNKNSILLTLIVLLLIIIAVFSFFGLMSALAVSIISLIFITILAMQFLRIKTDLLTDSEFQNTIITSALKNERGFVLIISSDGSVSYMDSGFRELFPEIALSTVDIIGELANICNFEVEKVVHKASIFFDINKSDARKTPMVLEVEKINKPIGYMVLRGRPFINRVNK